MRNKFIFGVNENQHGKNHADFRNRKEGMLAFRNGRRARWQ